MTKIHNAVGTVDSNTRFDSPIQAEWSQLFSPGHWANTAKKNKIKFVVTTRRPGSPESHHMGPNPIIVKTWLGPPSDQILPGIDAGCAPVCISIQHCLSPSWKLHNVTGGPLPANFLLVEVNNQYIHVDTHLRNHLFLDLTETHRVSFFFFHRVSLFFFIKKYIMCTHLSARNLLSF